MEIFITHGYPDEIQSDNGPQFSSDQFRRFAAHCGSKHVTSSPYFHQSNGAAERAVQTAKSILNLENPEQCLLDYRSSPCTVTGVSPAECLMGRRLRTRVPVLDSQLVPKSVAPEAVRARDRSAKEVYKHHYDRRHGARTHPSLKSGQPVLMRVDEEKGGWKKAGSVVESNMNRSYLVQMPDGSIYRRNRKHLLPLPQPPQKAVATYLYPPSGTAPSPGAPGPSPMIAGELPLRCMSYYVLTRARVCNPRADLATQPPRYSQTQSQPGSAPSQVWDQVPYKIQRSPCWQTKVMNDLMID